MNNPPLKHEGEKTRQESHKRLLNYLKTCQSIYRPTNLDTLTERIWDDETDKEKLQREVKEKVKELEREQEKNKQLQKEAKRHRREIQTEKENDFNYLDNNLDDIVCFGSTNYPDHLVRHEHYFGKLLFIEIYDLILLGMNGKLLILLLI